MASLMENKIRNSPGGPLILEVHENHLKTTNNENGEEWWADGLARPPCNLFWQTFSYQLSHLFFHWIMLF